jgi:hypothetical protein
MLLHSFNIRDRLNMLFVIKVPVQIKVKFSLLWYVIRSSIVLY